MMNMVNMMNVFIDKDMLENKKITSEGFCVYVALKYILDEKKNIERELQVEYVDVNRICLILYGNMNFNRYFSQNVAEGINNLLEKKVINLKQHCKNGYILNMKELEFHVKTKDSDVGNYYIQISDALIHKVMSIKTKSNKFNLLKYLCCMISTFFHGESIDYNIKNKVGMMNIDYLSEISGVSAKQLINKTNGYNKILEENKIIYIYRSNDYRENEFGGYQNFNNVYGLYENLDVIKKYGISLERSYGVLHKENKHIKEKDKTRGLNHRMARRISHLLSDGYYSGKQYSQEEIIDMYEWALNKYEKDKEEAKYKNIEFHIKYDPEKIKEFIVIDI